MRECALMALDRNAERRMTQPMGKRRFGAGVEGAASPSPAVREATRSVPPMRRLAEEDSAGA
jgi:hypothetical protein